eukprot:1095281-Rhodomonas_salina.3
MVGEYQDAINWFVPEGDQGRLPTAKSDRIWLKRAVEAAQKIPSLNQACGPAPVRPCCAVVCPLPRFFVVCELSLPSC